VRQVTRHLAHATFHLLHHSSSRGAVGGQVPELVARHALHLFFVRVTQGPVSGEVALKCLMGAGIVRHVDILGALPRIACAVVPAALPAHVCVVAFVSIRTGVVLPKHEVEAEADAPPIHVLARHRPCIIHLLGAVACSVILMLPTHIALLVALFSQ